MKKHQIVPDILLPNVIPNTSVDSTDSEFVAAWMAKVLRPLAKDADDINRLQQNGFSWPILDFAILVSVTISLLAAIGQWTLTGETTGLHAEPTLTQHQWFIRVLAFGLAVGIVYVGCAGGILTGSQREKSENQLIQAIAVFFGGGSVILLGVVLLDNWFPELGDGSTWLTTLFGFTFLGGLLASVIGFAAAIALVLFKAKLSGILALAIATTIGLFLAWIQFFEFILVCLFLAIGAAFCQRGYGVLGYLIFLLFCLTFANIAALTPINTSADATNAVIMWIIPMSASSFATWLCLGAVFSESRTNRSAAGSKVLARAIAASLVGASICAAIIFGCYTVIDATSSASVLDLTRVFWNAWTAPTSALWLLAPILTPLTCVLVPVFRACRIL